MRLSRYLRDRLIAVGVAVPKGDSPIVPVIIGDNQRTLVVAEAMQAQGFDVRAIRPPTVAPNSARLRIALNVGLDEATLDRFSAALASALTISPSTRVLMMAML